MCLNGTVIIVKILSEQGQAGWNHLVSARRRLIAPQHGCGGVADCQPLSLANRGVNKSDRHLCSPFAASVRVLFKKFAPDCACGACGRSMSKNASGKPTSRI